MNRRNGKLSREELISQLHYFDEFADELGRLASPAEKDRTYSLIQQYRERVERYVTSGQQPPEAEVLIGRMVTIAYEDGGAETYKLVLPNASNIDEGCLSFISPLGSKLVLSRTGDSVEVESPAGLYRVQVVDVV